MSKSTPPVRLRAATAEDVPFIFNSWLKSFKYSLWCRNIPSSIYFAEHHKLIERLLKECNVVVACNTEDSSQIFGFLCGQHVENIFCLHYIYVKHSFRNLGIAKAMLNSFSHDPSTASVYTHHTRVAEKVAPKYNMVYHPYLLINLPERDEENVESQ